MNIRKILLSVIVFMLLVLVACNSKETAKDTGVEIDEEELENLNEEGMPIVKEPISLNFFVQKTPSTANDFNDVMIYNKYEEKTNMNIQWEMVPSESLEEKRNLALASGSLPDVFHSAGMPADDIGRYGEQGVFIPLNDLIDKYAPNFKQLLDEYPEVEEAITFPDGNIYSFPQMADPDFLSVRMGPKPWINKDWLDALEMDMPETTEEFYAYLKAVKEGDPNGNGEADEIPYGATSIDTLYTFLRGSFGLANMGSENENIDLDPETNELRFFPIENGYKQLLEYMNRLYSEELIEQNIFSIEHTQYLANSAEGKYGSAVWYDPNPDTEDTFTGMPALEGPDGYKSFTTLGSPAINIGTFLITSENEHPVATIRWIDHFYGDEGMKEFFMGYEGETYEVNDDGELEYMDHILNSDEGLSRDQELAKYLTFPGGGYPSMLAQEYFNGAENSPEELEAADRLAPDLVEEIWPAFIYTKEENDKLAGFGADIEKYVEEMRNKFIAGNASFDEWDNYVKTIEDMKLSEYMSIKGDAYERYQENK